MLFGGAETEAPHEASQRALDARGTKPVHHGQHSPGCQIQACKACRKFVQDEVVGLAQALPVDLEAIHRLRGRATGVHPGFIQGTQGASSRQTYSGFRAFPCFATDSRRSCGSSGSSCGAHVPLQRRGTCGLCWSSFCQKNSWRSDKGGLSSHYCRPDMPPVYGCAARLNSASELSRRLPDLCAV